MAAHRYLGNKPVILYVDIYEECIQNGTKTEKEVYCCIIILVIYSMHKTLKSVLHMFM